MFYNLLYQYLNLVNKKLSKINVNNVSYIIITYYNSGITVVYIINYLLYVM